MIESMSNKADLTGIEMCNFFLFKKRKCNSMLINGRRLLFENTNLTNLFWRIMILSACVCDTLPQGSMQYTVC